MTDKKLCNCLDYREKEELLEATSILLRKREQDIENIRKKYASKSSREEIDNLELRKNAIRRLVDKIENTPEC